MIKIFFFNDTSRQITYKCKITNSFVKKKNLKFLNKTKNQMECFLIKKKEIMDMFFW